MAVILTDRTIKKVITMSEKRDRLNPDVRRQQILSVAIKMALRDGFNKLTRDGVANEAAVATGTINHSFGTMEKLSRAVMRAAINLEHLPIVAQGLAQGDKDAHAAPEWLKRKALDSLMSRG
jgi:AcrR family transcriptional regulator